MNSGMSLTQLQEAEAKYRGMFENAVEGIYQSTPDGRFLTVNAALARLYGYDRPEDLINQVSDIQNEIYANSAMRERFRQEIELTGSVRGMEYEVRRRDGGILWISESARAVRNEAGRILYYEGFIDDITARKQAEAERSQMEKQRLQAQKLEAIGLLAGGMVHDFNNILCAILGYTELSLSDQKIASQTRENLNAVLHSAQRAKDLIGRILTFSRPVEPARYPLKFGAILKEGVKLLNAMLPSSITINLAIRTEEDVVIADPTEMHQVIMNLGTNAKHAMNRRGGRLDYELELIHFNADQTQSFSIPAGSYIHLIVRDTGHGMAREIIDHIFEPFFTTKAPGHGTGLGLALVHKIVTRSGGYIQVESEEGKGSAFHIYLPQSLQPIAIPATDQNQLCRGRRERILVVDDEVPVLSMMQQQLRKLGYRVITRADSLDALETFRAEPDKFDLIITDHTMPSLQGAELAEKMGEIRPDMPAILMTGLNQPPSFIGSRFAPLRAVVLKPINFSELSHRLRGFLDQPAKPHRFQPAPMEEPPEA
jgi:two-component system, cell cycle sensor histidine kinase and response regulator CckA